MIIDQPCVTCGISLERGVKTVAFVDIIKGIVGIIVGSIVLVHYYPEPVVVTHKVKHGVNKTEDIIKEKIEVWYYDGFWISLTLLIVSFIDIFLAILLFVSAKKKSVPVLHFWLIVTGFLTPVNIFLMKIYEMIVVFAYTEDLTCEAGGKALEEFRKLPYVCNLKTQLYPSPVYGPETPMISNPSGKCAERVYLTEKSYLMNMNTSVFSMVQHQHC